MDSDDLLKIWAAIGPVVTGAGVFIASVIAEERKRRREDAQRERDRRQALEDAAAAREDANRERREAALEELVKIASIQIAAYKGVYDGYDLRAEGSPSKATFFKRGAELALLAPAMTPKFRDLQAALFENVKFGTRSPTAEEVASMTKALDDFVEASRPRPASSLALRADAESIAGG